MRIHHQLVGCLALLGVSLGAPAKGLDGSSPVLCAATEAVQCDAGATCTKGSAASVNLPLFFRIDVAGKVVKTTSESGKERTSRVSTVTTDSDTIVLQGAEQGFGWTLTVGQSTGQMSLTASKSGVGYIVFGACTAL